MMTVRKSAGVAVLLLALSACTDRPAVDSDIYDKAVANNKRSWADQRRDKLRRPADILRLSGLEPGMVALDLMGGGGYYAELMSYVVGASGKVILQNNTLFLKFSEEELEKRLRNDRLPNVERLDSQFSDFQLPDDIDLIFLGLSYHDIYIKRSDPVKTTSREEFFPQIWDALKPGGRVLVIDHAAARGTGFETTEALHRIAEDFAIDDFERAGFLFLDSVDVLRNPDDDHSLRMREAAIRGKTDRFVLLFEKPAMSATLESTEK